mgnify:CR=1 FL=1|jgi:hypothetical protein
MNKVIIRNRIEKEKHLSYGDWWRSRVSGSGDDWNITHGDYVVEFYKSLQSLLHSQGRHIINEKQFKREIATLIYNLSDESL